MNKKSDEIVLMVLNQLISVTVILVIMSKFYHLSSEPKLIGILFFTPFAYFPILITQLTGFLFRHILSQLLGLLALISYSIWFWLVYMTLVHWTSDAQNPIGFIFVGIYSLPVMFFFWLGQYLIYRKFKNPNKVASGNPTPSDS